MDSIGTDVAEMQAMLAAESAPDIQPSRHCLKPYTCPYYEHCTRNIPQPEHGIGELSGIMSERREELEAMGIIEVRDVPADFPLNELQSIIRQAVIDGSATVHGDLARSLAEMSPPVRHLDFESFQLAIPRFAGTRAYDQIPFLFSVHTELGEASLESVDYIHEDDSDPRPRLIENLLEALGEEGSICTYSSFERTQLKALATAFPQYADAIDDIVGRLVDLLPILRGSYYHPGFHGSFSIKAVLPVVAPELGYDDLEIADGQLASVRYARALASASPRERRQNFDSLRAYCARDTLAMVELRNALLAVARASA